MAVIKYYNQKELLYTSRKRYSTLSNFTEYAEETQQKVLFGDGAKTSIKTTVDRSAATYVTIDGTRWFVVDHIYINGGQITLHLLRDVIGEFGLNNCFGKVERGISNNILAHRKELGLNQILKQRKKIYPDTTQYGLVSTNTHEDEMWGVFYFTKPNEDQTFKLPNLEYEVTSDLPYNANGYSYVKSASGDLRFTIYFRFIQGSGSGLFGSTNGYKVTITINHNEGNYSVTNVDAVFSDYALSNNAIGYKIRNLYGLELVVAREVGFYIGNKIINGQIPSTSLPEYPTIQNEDNSKYNNTIVADIEKFYRVSVGNNVYFEDGRNTDLHGTDFLSAGEIISFKYGGTSNSVEIEEIDNPSNNKATNVYSNFLSVTAQETKFYEVANKSLGELTISSKTEYVDEPFVVNIIPLYNCTLNINGEPKQIDKEQAFYVFNELISLTSGTNALLVDAQIYPYCPDLTSVYQDVLGVPIFEVLSTSYSRQVSLSVQAFEDIKKDYICREYSIISPEQSNKTFFEYYDYTNNNYSNISNGQNNHPLTCYIKTALKPYTIISSFVISPEPDSLMGQTYDSDLRGCQPTGGGFECSISTDQFQQYVRNNSNYNNMFELQKQELQKQHEVERRNEIASIVVNTTTATMMGAIGGASLGAGPISKSIMGVGGAVAAGAVVGGAMGAQFAANEDLREYEETLLQQRFDLEIGTIKNLPNSVSRISSFNNILMNDFCYVLEIYECSEEEKDIVDVFLNMYAYELGIYDYFINYCQQNNFIKGQLITSELIMNLQNLASKELGIGIYYIQGGTQ